MISIVLKILDKILAIFGTIFILFIIAVSISALIKNTSLLDLLKNLF